MRTLTTGIALALLASLTLAASAEDVTFAFAPPDGWEVTSVSIRGSFNDWGETPMEQADDGTWSAVVELEPGECEYKFFINGEWPQDMETWLDGFAVDETAESYTDDGHGGQNAVRVVGTGGGGAPAVEESFPQAPELQDGFARLHYHRPKGGYGGWGLHVWGDTNESVDWTSPMEPTGRDAMGLYWDFSLTDGAESVGLIIHKGDTKDPGPDMFLTPATHGREVWLISGRANFETEPPDVESLALGDLTRQRAYWPTGATLAMRVRKAEGNVYRLHSCMDAELELTADGVTGGQFAVLTPDPAGLPEAVTEKFPHLRGYTALALADGDLARAPELLKGQLVVSVTDADGKLVDATGVQIPGVLDDLFTYDGSVGVTWGEDGAPSVSVWAPTAQDVRLHVFDASTDPESSSVVPMAEDAGVWTVEGQADWKDKFYLYEVRVFVPSTGAVESNLVTDPYSRSLSTDSRRSQMVDLSDPALQPDGWADLAKPVLEAPEDMAIYELHVRDFSASDPTCPAEFAGTYRAFTVESNGTDHLRGLAEAGLTHVHLLPTFDIASVNEDKSTWLFPGDLSQYPSDSDRQQEAISGVSGQDPYNWGYDPYHYGVPEGSYSTDPDGSTRILEFRELVQALSDMGLRVVMDVVYNHTHASGVSDKSVLDKVVPGYYHRLNRDGFVETSTCCQNTATEHYMMRRLMVDDLVHWATDFKVDGFRFDLMGHHMKADMIEARDALHALRPDTDGVDGEAIYLYGEGWDFGEVQGGKRGVNATQANMAGTGIGTFNDRIRDAIRGGSAFSDRREQGFATGMFLDPNGYNQGTGPDRGTLLKQADRIRVGMAGNLAAYRFIDHTGREMRGGAFESVGYTSDPGEAINYCSAHDNETFFDKTQYSASPSATLADRVRMQNVGLSVVALGQGIPFFHAGSDMLRSKSMEADSYNAGDWFNRLDWSYESNNFGVGLPSAEKNYDRWNIIRPLLARTDITPGSEEILASVRHLREMLRIRKSSHLFRLRTAEDVMGRVRFLNTGADQIPGLIVMEVSDEVEGMRSIDENFRRVVVLINAAPDAVVFDHAGWKGASFERHPVQVSSADEVAKQAVYDEQKAEFTVPGRTAAVFVVPR